MKLPFTSEQFFNVFRDYNQSVWPMQIFLLAIAIIALVIPILKYKRSDIFIGSILSLLWIWMGVVYHLLYFSKINPAAYLFGALFILQGIIFFWIIVIKKKVTFQFHRNLHGMIGAVFILFALLLYPLIGHTQGHIYPASPSFGLPCPTTIFTFGILLWSTKKLPFYLPLIPVLWSILGFTASFTLGVKEDIGLLIAGILFSILILFKKSKQI